MPVAGCQQVPVHEVKVVEQEGEVRNMAQEEEKEQKKEESEVEVVEQEDKMIMTQQEGEEEASNADQVPQKTDDWDHSESVKMTIAIIISINGVLQYDIVILHYLCYASCCVHFKSTKLIRNDSTESINLYIFENLIKILNHALFNLIFFLSSRIC